MTLSQWTQSAAGGSSDTLTGSSPLVGSFSLSTLSGNSLGNSQPILRALTSGANIANGKIRSLVKPLSGATTNPICGVFGMMQTSISTTNQAYWLTIGSTFGATTWELRKSGLSNISGLLTSGALGYTLALNSFTALELEWQRDSGAGVTALYVRVGTSPGTTDFSDLTQRTIYVDTSGFSTGVSAGVGQFGKDATVVFDQTTIFGP